VYADGGICLDILQNQWSPIYDVSAILTSIQVGCGSGAAMGWHGQYLNVDLVLMLWVAAAMAAGNVCGCSGYGCGVMLAGQDVSASGLLLCTVKAVTVLTAVSSLHHVLPRPVTLAPQSLLCDPNPNSPANSEAARLYNENR
jgi:hypothetical protein